MAITTTRDKVRLEIGDTDATRKLFYDDEIDVKLAARADNVLLTAADLCDILATRLARDFDFQWKDGQFSRSQAAKMYAERAVALRARAASDGAVPLYGFPPISYPLVF